MINHRNASDNISNNHNNDNDVVNNNNSISNSDNHNNNDNNDTPNLILRIGLKHNLHLKGWNSQVHREVPGKLEFEQC